MSTSNPLFINVENSVENNIEKELIENNDNIVADNNIIAGKIYNCKCIMGAIFAFIIVCTIIYIISCYCNNNNEGFNNNNMLEQQMFQEMTEENKQIYLELSEEGKIDMFNTWKKMKNL